MPRSSQIKDYTLSLAVIFKDAFLEWLRNDAPRRAASVAYFAAFTLAPLLIVLTGIFSLMMAQELMRETLLEQIQVLAGSQASDLADRVLTNMADRKGGVWSTVVGLGISIFAATTVFSQLQHQMNRMWEVKSRPGKGVLLFFAHPLDFIRLYSGHRTVAAELSGNQHCFGRIPRHRY